MPGARFAVFALLYCCAIRAQKGGPPDPVQTLLREGESAFRQGDYPAARESLEKALRMTRQLPAGSVVRYEVLKRLTSVSAASGQLRTPSAILSRPSRGANLRLARMTRRLRMT